jgi:hypothetical protein
MPIALALILIRTAFRASFQPLAARRTMLEAVDQYLEGFFQDPEVLASVAELVPT